MPFHHEVRIRYGEVDMQRVVFNAHYLAYADDAMTHWMGAFGFEYTQLGWDCMVVHAEIDWRGWATFEDVLELEGEIERWGRSSFALSFRCHVGDREVCTVGLTYVGVALGTTNPMPPPDEFKQALEKAAAG